jgi:hypothetical protein
MSESTLEFTDQILQPVMHEKILLRAAELVALGWTRGTAARDAEHRGRHAGPVRVRHHLVDHAAPVPGRHHVLTDRNGRTNDKLQVRGGLHRGRILEGLFGMAGRVTADVARLYATGAGGGHTRSVKPAHGGSITLG